MRRPISARWLANPKIVFGAIFFIISIATHLMRSGRRSRAAPAAVRCRCTSPTLPNKPTFRSNNLGFEASDWTHITTHELENEKFSAGGSINPQNHRCRRGRSGLRPQSDTFTRKESGTVVRWNPCSQVFVGTPGCENELYTDKKIYIYVIGRCNVVPPGRNINQGICVQHRVMNHLPRSAGSAYIQVTENLQISSTPYSSSHHFNTRPLLRGLQALIGGYVILCTTWKKKEKKQELF